MKVYGNYYKNTIYGKKRTEFELELPIENNEVLGELRKIVTPILRKRDKEFRGIRELRIETKQTERIPNIADVASDVMNESLLRGKAKKLGIRYYWAKSMNNLIREIAEKEQDSIEEEGKKKAKLSLQ
jgi:hypothetical protein